MGAGRWMARVVVAALGAGAACGSVAARAQDVDVEAVLAALVAEALGLAQAQEAAIAAHGLLAPDPGAERAARRSAAVPDDVTVDAGWRAVGGARDEWTQTDRLDALGALEDTTWRELGRDDRARQLDLGLRVSWDLRGLVWGDAEVDAAELETERAEARVELAREVGALYHARLRALGRYLLAGDDAEARLAAALDVAALTADLDVLTGGAFSRAARSPLPPRPATR